MSHTFFEIHISIVYRILNASSVDTLTWNGRRRFLSDRRRKVHFSLIKWLRYRKQRKKVRRITLQPGAACIPTHSNGFSLSLAHPFASFSRQFIRVYRIQWAVISRNSVWRTSLLIPERKVRIVARFHWSVHHRRKLKAGYMRDLKSLVVRWSDQPKCDLVYF